MSFKEYYDKFGICLLEQHMLDALMMERDDDDEFRKKAMEITEKLIDEAYCSTLNVYNGTGLRLRMKDFGDDNIAATYSNRFGMINVNIENNGELYKKDFKKFLQSCKYDIFHEVIHFLDYSRHSEYEHMRDKEDVKNKPPSKIKSQSDVNSPFEFNAYYNMYIQALEDAVVSEIKNGNTNEVFRKYMGINSGVFIKNFWIVIKNNQGQFLGQYLSSPFRKFKANYDKLVSEYWSTERSYYEISRLIDQLGAPKDLAYGIALVKFRIAMEKGQSDFTSILNELNSYSKFDSEEKNSVYSQLFNHFYYQENYYQAVSYLNQLKSLMDYTQFIQN
jgi:hypothetical protein